MTIPNYGDKYDSPALFSAPTRSTGRVAISGPKFQTPSSSPISGTSSRRYWRSVRAIRSRSFGTSRFIPSTNTSASVGGFSIGAPATGTVAENLIAAGAEVLCIVGSGGTLQQDIEPIDAVIADRAIRDEGVSYHYLPPEKDATPSLELTDRLEARFEDSEVTTHRGTTWTTSAFYRETVAEIERYAEDGVVSVEMEAAALFAVAEFRGVDAAAVFDIGDLLTEEEWDSGVGYENLQPKLLDPAIAALHDLLGVDG
ncbi:nucleoside phosphorylase [Haladaptatus sp. R4]|uniref:nucleoside phosphorylase n=1 Tax=Haladaptatus sp. R4 TaxID=1679489 RepID=UPI001CBAAE34|nr:nucleoside phosphorylase [Haladaptatus sp. R4]